MEHSDVGLSEEPLVSTAPELASDEFYRALANTSRRRLLFALLNTESDTIDDLAELLYGWASTADEQPEYEQIQSVLYHTHLPTLDAAGLVEFDHEAGTVEPADLPGEVEALIQQSIAAEIQYEV